MGSIEVPKAGRTVFKQMAVGALKETSDSCHIVKQSTWLWRAKTALKNTDSLKSWWLLLDGRSALGQLITVGEWGGCPSPQPIACVGHGAGDGARNGTVRARREHFPEASNRWETADSGCVPGASALHPAGPAPKRKRLCCLHPHFGGQIPRTLFKPYSDEPPIESMETFSEQRLNKEVEESIAEGTDGPSDLIGLFHLTL